MPRKPKPPLPLSEQVAKLKAAMLNASAASSERKTSGDAEMEPLEVRVRRILGIIDKNRKEEGRMVFFVMYDIESDKVRALVHKYLKRMGCTPIQRSIFLADASMDIYRKIQSDLSEVQQAYDNNDSIIVLPVTTDYLHMMKIIGQKIEVDVITHSKSTLFF